jgi:ABC-type multidrug transport system, ATPase and permease components
MREQLSAIVSVLCLVPTAIYMDWRLASLLAVLAVIYTILNVTVVYRTSDGQASVERYYVDVFGRVGDVIGNVPVVQSYGRLSAEATALRDLMNQLLAAQYPVLTWWVCSTSSRGPLRRLRWLPSSPWAPGSSAAARFPSVKSSALSPLQHC